MSLRNKGFFLALLATGGTAAGTGCSVNNRELTVRDAGSGGAGDDAGATGGANPTGSGGATSTGSGGSASGGAGGAPVSDGGDDRAPGTDTPPDGTTTDAPTGPVAPVMRNGRYAFDLGDLVFEVDPQVGGRITTFALGGANILTGPMVHPIYWGSTFWTSPESQWTQPPPLQIDSAPFTASTTATSVTLVGPSSPLLGVNVSKTFSADRGRGAVQIDYKITNNKAATIHMAPWEVTRVFPGGVTFFPTGSKTTLSNGATLPTTTSAGLTWFAYDATKITADSKLIADAAEGWLAHAADGWVFIKKFTDLTPAQIAPNEGDVELYTNKVHTYIELENQGPYVDIPMGGSTSWTVTWFLKRLPAGTTATAGDAALAQLVRDTIR